MFSVIIPTMWKSRNFLTFLYDLINYSLVGEVLIIDNNESERPEDMILTCHYKVKVISSGKNIYVNPAWNLGVECALYDKICILNDNSIFDLKLFNRVYSYVSCNLGVIGINWNYETINDGMIRINGFRAGDMTNNFFRCFFVHKDSWKPIPKELKLYFGDDYIFNSCLIEKKQIFVINDLFFYTEFGGTTRKMDEAKEMFIKEKEEYYKILIKQGVDPMIICPHHYK